jgi:hypothetical protein
MSLEDDDVPLAGLLERWGDALADELHAAAIGRVESYDAAAQIADVTPVVKRAQRRADGSVAYEQLPTIRAVRVAFPRWGSWFVHAPLVVGDTVLLVVLDRDPSRWVSTGQVCEPIDRRLHHISHAVAIPGLFPRSKALASASRPTDALVLGRDGGALLKIKQDGTIEAAGTAALALSAQLTEHLDAIAADHSAIKTAIEGLTGGTPFPLQYDTAGKAVLDASQPIATTKVKGA